METRLIEGWLDIAPQWLNFALRFPVSPKSVLAPYARAGTVSKDLMSLNIPGVALSYLFVQVIGPRSLAKDQGNVARFFRKIDPKLLPPTVLFFLVAFAVVLHALARLYLALFGAPDPSHASPLGGTVEDTVNATLAFASVYIPFATFLFCLTMRALSASARTKVSWLTLLPSVLPNLAFVVVYWPLSVAAVHPNATCWQAFLALCGAGVLGGVGVFLLVKFGDNWLRVT